MPYFFIFSLATCLVATYISKKSADEIAYLSAAIAVVSFLLTLVLAPWQIQCLLLVLLLLSNRWWSASSQPVVTPQSEEEEAHQLVYRGANYEPTTPTVEIAEGEIAGKYRGQVWRAHNPVKVPPVSQPTLNIKYRGAGVTDQNTPTSVVKTTAVEEVEEIPDVVLEAHSS